MHRHQNSSAQKEPKKKRSAPLLFRAVGNRCAIAQEDLPLPLEGSLTILTSLGFKVVPVDLLSLARGLIGQAQYRRGARPSEAPGIVDCSSMIKWLYGQRGIWLPRRTVQQRECGEVVYPAILGMSDLLFLSGHINYYEDDPAFGVGHVGIITDDETIIHAANREMGVIEEPFRPFIRAEKFRGAQRIIPQSEEVLTFLTPPEREVETSDDIRWIIRQNMK